MGTNIDSVYSLPPWDNCRRSMLVNICSDSRSKTGVIRIIAVVKRLVIFMN